MFRVYHSFTLFTNVDILINMTDFIYKMDKMEDTSDGRSADKIRFIISFKEQEVGSLYFEKAKKGFTNKPLSMDAWVCVDAKIEKLYEVSDYEIIPKEIVEVCQKMIKAEYL